MIQIKRNEILIPDKELIKSLRREFAETNCVFLPQFLDTFIVNYLIKRLETTGFVPKYETSGDYNFGKTLFIPQSEPVVFTFHLLLNNPKLFRIIEEMTHCQAIGNFHGRMHRSVPGEDHSIGWHEDDAHHRLLGLTVDLSAEKYTGGKFQLRETKTGKMLREITETSAGDAFIFRISPDLQHQLTVLESGGNRTVGVGWFSSEPDRQTFAKNYFLPPEIQI